ncbi:MAG: NYN domain-containing protein [Alphaproteobacteria bacterium]|nr:NYN domain-containing protein [Alphaproteobacteria bacterium]
MRDDEKTALFIDGANLYKAARSLGFDMDYRSLLAKARDESQLVRAYYYTAMQEERGQEFSPLRPLVDWLDYNGYAMILKQAREFTDAQGRRRFKGSIDVELAVDMVAMAAKLDHIILFSGNGDFRRAVELVQSMGVRVTVVSTIKSAPPMASDELRRQADLFVDLADIQKQIGRAGGQRTTQRQESPAAPEDELYEGEDEDFEDF